MARLELQYKSDVAPCTILSTVARYLISGTGVRVPNFRDGGTVTEILTCLKSGITLESGIMKTNAYMYSVYCGIPLLREGAGL